MKEELTFNEFWFTLPSSIMKGFLMYNVAKNIKDIDSNNNNNKASDYLKLYLHSTYSLCYTHASAQVAEYGSVTYKSNRLHASFVFIYSTNIKSAATDPYLTFNIRTLTHELTHAHIEFARLLGDITPKQASVAHRLLHAFDVYGTIPEEEFIDVYKADFRQYRIINANKVIKAIKYKYNNI
jgi:hypothetical protein